MGRTRFLSDDDLRKLLTAAKKHSSVMHTAIGVSIATGIGQGELPAQSRVHADLVVDLLPLLCLAEQCGRA